MTYSVLKVPLNPNQPTNRSTETAECRIMQTMPHDSPGTLVF